MDIHAVQQQLREFADARDWHRFHCAKNLAMALCGEAGELAEIFQWLDEQSADAIIPGHPDHTRVRHEVADIQLYLLRLCDRLQLDLTDAVAEKLALNAQKYPIGLSRGNAVKYNRRDE